MATADILNAAADFLESEGARELNGLSGPYSASAAISHVAPDEISSLDAIKAFSRFLRTDGVGSERQIGTMPAQIATALRQAAREAS